ncbi:hypothetical protein [Cytobacillus stercorigallinarum]|nr:hypothetical protein [Cytobacillus stercorigallinarum]
MLIKSVHCYTSMGGATIVAHSIFFSCDCLTICEKWKMGVFHRVNWHYAH